MSKATKAVTGVAQPPPSPPPPESKDEAMPPAVKALPPPFEARIGILLPIKKNGAKSKALKNKVAEILNNAARQLAVEVCDHGAYDIGRMNVALDRLRECQLFVEDSVNPIYQPVKANK